MIKLHGRLTHRWDDEPLVLRVTTDADRPDDVRPVEALRVRPGQADVPLGFGAYLANPGDHQPESSNLIVELPLGLDHLSAGDVIEIAPRSGQVSVLYRMLEHHNSMLLTERCNSNCLMCSQPPKADDDSHLVDMWLKAIPFMDPLTPELGITGGEPTLLGDRLIEVIAACKEHLPETSLHVLTNGRLFSYLSLCRSIASVEHPDLMFGIPLYGDLPHVHDFVVQAAGAFDQTIRGILNAHRCGLHVEIRVVLHRQTVDRLPQLADFIARNLPFVNHVAFMGLEPMGYVKMNFGALWIDPADYQAGLVPAVERLAAHRLMVSIYNHQLCVLDPALWPYARKSISDWKNDYLPLCDTCGVRADCGGFFSSAIGRHSSHIHAPPNAIQSEPSVLGLPVNSLGLM